MDKKMGTILKEVSERINPKKEEVDSISKFVKELKGLLEKNLRQQKIKAEIFVGGSFAKNTLIKKGQYDIDLFVRFEEKYKGKNISKFLGKAVGKIKKMGEIILIHGSRDYFKIVPKNANFFVEVIPVIKTKNPKEAENITDLSYFHVSYIRKKLKSKMLEDVRLAKAFCHATNCYGAESYINGFSGYAIELLVYHYKGFLNFLKAMTRIEKQEIIDTEKLYKNKSEIMMNMNSAKMGSPLVLIDPTYKERNALAALSNETFQTFKKACKKFIASPSMEMFDSKRINPEKIKKDAKKSKSEFIFLSSETDKQEGDIAGSKLAKFYKHLTSELGKFYEIKNKGFEYKGKKESEFFFVAKSRGKVIVNGPNAKDKKNAALFRKKHKDIFIKKGRVYARDKISKKIAEFIKDWMNKNSDKMIEMHITELRITG